MVKECVTNVTPSKRMVDETARLSRRRKPRSECAIGQPPTSVLLFGDGTIRVRDVPALAQAHEGDKMDSAIGGDGNDRNNSPGEEGSLQKWLQLDKEAHGLDERHDYVNEIGWVQQHLAMLGEGS
jgi:hypothetical protein